MVKHGWGGYPVKISPFSASYNTALAAPNIEDGSGKNFRHMGNFGILKKILR